MNHINRRKAATLFVITALFASILAIPTAITANTSTPASFSPGKIVFDYSHGQESTYAPVVLLDSWLDGNLTELGYDVVWARGGINATILSDAVGFIAGSKMGATNAYLPAEVTAIADWFNSGNKFMWISYDSDFTSLPDQSQANSDNMTMILEAVGSHIYGEPTAVEDPVSSANSAYRVIANTTTDNPNLQAFVDGVSAVLMHGPTLLYGADGDATTNPVDLETNTVEDVYPLLYYGGNATINDGDAIDPIAHEVNEQGSFVAMALENHAGEDESGALIVSGASPYGDYQPMYSDVYYSHPLDGYNLVLNTIQYGILAALQTPGEGKIVFDYSHGQESSYGPVVLLDNILRQTLFLKGYDTVWARGGINASILDGAVAFIAGSKMGATNAYLPAEVTAIADWFNEGRRFMWISYDSDFTSLPDQSQANSDNMTMILEAVGSLVYGEPTAVEDPVSSANSAYRVIANTTSDDPFVADIVEGVSAVLMHGPTLLYSANGSADANPVDLETHTVDNVYPILYYGGNATINDGDAIDPITHEVNEQGSFVAMTLEMEAGDNETGLLVVSGASPYGDYQPMFSDVYYGHVLDGYNLVLNTIDFGIAHIPPLPEPTTPPDTTPTSPTTGTGGGLPLDTTTLLIIGGAALVVIIIIIVVAKRR